MILHDDRLGGDTTVDEIRPTDSSFGEGGVSTGAACGHDVEGQLLSVELEGLIEAELEDRRRAATVLGGSHDENDVGLLGVVNMAFALDADGEGGQVGEQKRQQRQCQKAEPASEVCQSDFLIVSPGSALSLFS